MESVGDKIMAGGLTFRELLILAFAVGGHDAEQVVPAASTVVAAMDRAAANRPLSAGKLRVHGVHDGKEEG